MRHYSIFTPLVVIVVASMAVAGPAKCFRLTGSGSGCSTHPPEITAPECIHSVVDEMDVRGYEETSAEGRTEVNCVNKPVCAVKLGYLNAQGVCVANNGQATAITLTCELDGAVCNEGEGED